MNHLYFIAILLISQFFERNEGASCTTYSDKDSCDGNNLCTWFTAEGGYCACSSTYRQEVIFVMDSSGSVSSSGWTTEQQFVTSMITSGMDDNSYAAVMNFASGAWTQVNFTEPLSDNRDDIVSHVNSMAFTGGNTWMLAAVEMAMVVFDKTGDPNIDNLMMLITDGNPRPSRSQKVCPSDDSVKTELDNAGIKVVVIGVGSSWRTSAISCLVDDESTQIIYVDDFSDDDFDAVRTFTDDFLCPATISLKLTEVRVEDSTTDVQTDAKFVEFYVDGVTIPLESNQLILGGMVTGTITTSTYANLTAGSYVTFYDSSTTDNPKCHDCDSCTDGDSDGFCDNQIYIPCDGPGGDSYECEFASGYDNTNWAITVQDGSDLSYVVDVDVTVDASTWPSVTDGWTFELKDKTDNDDAGANWEMSCFQYGTPGDAPIEDCTGNCQEQTCQENGDSNAYCSSGATGTCQCTAANGYFRSGSACLPIESPASCQTDTYREEAAEDGVYWQTVEISWDAVTLSGITGAVTEYEVQYTDKNGLLGFQSLGSSTQVLYVYIEDANREYTSTTTEPQVRFVLSINNGTLYSDWVTCPITTAEPTEQPTLAPTYAIPLIDSCNATVVQGSTNVLVEWDEADLSSVNDAPPDQTGYYLFYSIYEGPLTSDPGELSSSTLEYTLSLGGEPGDIGTFGPEDLVVSVSAVGYDGSGELDTTRMYATATECDLFTPAPTKAPTSLPSGSPTVRPSLTPSSEPTSSPTYDDWVLTNCEGMIQQGGDSLIFSWEQPDPEPASSRTVRIIREVGGEGSSTTEGPVFVTDVNSVTEGSVTIDGTAFTDLTINDGYYIYPEAAEKPGASAVEQVGTYCEIATGAPSPEPTRLPSGTPSRTPTGVPSATPSNEPTNEPSPAPTYLDVVIEDCSYELAAQDVSFTVTFTEPDFDETGITTPTSDTATYLFEWTDDNNEEQRQFFSAKTALATYLQTVGTSGFDLDNGLTVTVYFETTKAAGPAADCVASTQEPSPSPTTAAPTPAPTYANPQVYIDVSSIVSDPVCAQDTETLEWTCYVKESDTSSTNIDIIRTPEVFPFDISFNWEIGFITSARRNLLSKGTSNDINELKNVMKDVKQRRRRRMQTDGVITDTSSPFATEDDFSGDTEADVTLEGSTGVLENTEQVSINLIQEDDSVEERQERFYFQLVSCEMADADTDANDQYSCTVGEPSEVLMYVNDVPPDELNTSKKTGDLPTWIWYVIGAGVITLPIVGWFGWRFYNQKKLAEAMEAQRKQDLAEQMALDDAGNFGEIGDAVQFNPLATGGTQDIATGGDYIDQQLNQQKENFEVAHVDIEQNVFRQDFGPVQTHQRQDFGPVQKNQRQDFGPVQTNQRV